VLSAVPQTFQTRIRHFGKVHLVGWESRGTCETGSTLSLKLYWRSVKKLDRGYHLFTHLAAPDGKLYAFDDVGPLRETVSESEFGKVPRLPPSAWTPGMIYVDEQTLTVPDVDAQTLALSVGLNCELFAPGGGPKVGEFALQISDVSDGRHGARSRVSRRAFRGGKSQKEDVRRRPGLRPDDQRPSTAARSGSSGGCPAPDKESRACWLVAL
jgi:hypothetical protein